MDNGIKVTSEMWQKNMVELTRISGSLKAQGKDIKRLSFEVANLHDEMKTLTTLLQGMVNTYATKSELELTKKEVSENHVNRVEWTEHCATSTVAIENGAKVEKELDALHKRLDKIDLKYAKLTGMWAVVVTVFTFLLNNIDKIIELFKR